MAEKSVSRWQEICVAFSALAEACRSGADIASEWEAFASLSRESERMPPTHLVVVLRRLKNLAPTAEARGRVTILDHGTGTGINILYLAALGYHDVWGANVVPKAQPQNRVFREILGKAEDRIFQYDGQTLPLADGTVDLVLSQQVVEHLPDAVIDSYYAEEGRILRNGGVALHQVPHRWMPYDGHTRTWFFTLLPDGMRLPIWKKFASNPDQIGNYLFLRDRKDHFQRAIKYIGDTHDDSLLRLKNTDAMADYHGPKAIALVRRAVGSILRIPGLGQIALGLFRPFSMMETVSTKSS